MPACDPGIEFLKHHAGDRRHVDGCGFPDRHPDQFDQFGIRADHAFDLVSDAGGVGREKAGVEALRPPRRGDGAGDEMNACQIGMNFGLGEFLPDFARRRRRGVALARRAAGRFPPPVRARRRAQSRAPFPGWGWRRAPAAWPAVSGCSSLDRRHRAVERLDAAARKHEFSRHEFVAVMAAAEQNLRGRAGAVDQHHGRGVARLAGGRGLIAFRLRHAVGQSLAEIVSSS